MRTKDDDHVQLARKGDGDNKGRHATPLGGSSQRVSLVPKPILFTRVQNEEEKGGVDQSGESSVHTTQDDRQTTTSSKQPILGKSRGKKRCGQRPAQLPSMPIGANSYDKRESNQSRIMTQER